MATTDPNNVEVKKGFVFNETGNIMMATTDLTSDTIEQSVRDVFAEVSVFFAAMTKALEKNAADDMIGEDETGKITGTKGNAYNFSLYDYEAMKKIIDNSGCFIQVNEEDVTHTTSSWGADFSKELVEAVLGLATGTGELAFAQAMVSSLGNAGLQINRRTTSGEKKVANIIFVCEYLLGMPVISAVVITADMKTQAQSFSLGPCIKEHSKSVTIKVHKDTYMFVTPAFIKQYSGDLISGINDPDFEKLTGIFSNYLNPSTGSGSGSGDGA